MTPIEIGVALLIAAVIAFVIYQYGHNSAFKAKFDADMKAAHDKLDQLLHRNTVVDAQASPAAALPPALPSPVPTPVPAPVVTSVTGFDGKTYPDAATAKAAWVAAGHPTVDYLQRALDVDGNPYTGFSPPPILAAQVTWNPDGSYTKTA